MWNLSHILLYFYFKILKDYKSHFFLSAWHCKDNLLGGSSSKLLFCLLLLLFDPHEQTCSLAVVSAGLMVE
jgi:hypothetical protein